MPHEQPWLDKEPKYIMPKRTQQIRGICITDCTEQDDYRKIVWLCEANDTNLHWSDALGSLLMISYPKRLLYDDGDNRGFMHQWARQEKNPAWFEEYKKTLRCMTVKEFYATYDPEFFTDNKID